MEIEARFDQKEIPILQESFEKSSLIDRSFAISFLPFSNLVGSEIVFYRTEVVALSENAIAIEQSAVVFSLESGASEDEASEEIYGNICIYSGCCKLRRPQFCP